MNKSKLLEDGDQFEELKEEVLTYTLSEPINNSPINTHHKKVTKIHEKHRLGLMPNREERKESEGFDFKSINKNIKKVECNMGRIIPIGPVTFKSNFQCGNINNVLIIAQNAYEVELEKETNSDRVSSWFYFSVEGVRGEAHFVIKGFTKSSSLFNEGMKICYRDSKEIAKWRRGGTRISYSESEANEEEKHSYELRFSHFFKNNEHTCIQFAYCFPYGLKKLYSLLSHVREYATIENLCKSYLRFNIPLLTIGNCNSQEVIILSARVHPGETVSSFIMEGFIKELVADNQFGKMLRSKYLFKIVPMLNPDGVVRGNYRFSAYGCDLNRKWKSCKQSSQPEIFFMRELIRKQNKEKKVIMYIDIHGHSRKKSVFFYGCCQTGEQLNSKPKEFPFLMEKIYEGFRYQNCCFSIQKDKDGTARVAMWKQLQIDYVYTLQSTFCGPEYGTNYLQNDYEKIGKKLCEGLAVFFYEPNNGQVQKKQSGKLLERLSAIKQKAFQQLYENKQLLQMGDLDDSGSQSEPQVGEIAEKDRNPETGLPRPESLVKQLKRESARVKLSAISTRCMQASNAGEPSKFEKQKSQMFVVFQQAGSMGVASTQKQIQNLRSKVSYEMDSSRKFDKFQIRIASNAVNTYQLQTLRASSLYQKNVRVHSLTRNNDRNSERNKKIINPFAQEGQAEREEKLKIDLMHGKEGVQYRRVRKLAEQNHRHESSVSSNNNFIRELAGNQIQVSGMLNSNKNHLNNHFMAYVKNHKSTIAPRFFPSAQQKNRRNSIELSLKRPNRIQQLKKMSINGDQFNVKGIGKNALVP